MNRIARSINRILKTVAFVCVVLATPLALRAETLSPDARGQQLYQQMLRTYGATSSLSYKVRWRNASQSLGEETVEDVEYRVWLKKPLYVRIEVSDRVYGSDGVLVGDGETCWSYWPSGFPWPQQLPDDLPSDAARKVYFRTPMYSGKGTECGNSISHQFNKLGVAGGLPILNPSHFFLTPLYFESLLEKVTWKGEEEVAGVLCDVVEASYPSRQRTLTYWIAKTDHLPRKAREVFQDLFEVDELWLDLQVNPEISDDEFFWRPGEGWFDPNAISKPLSKGVKAPEFSVKLVDGRNFDSEDHLGKVIWLSFWRIHCPPCRPELRFMQELFSRYEDLGFLPLGFNVADNSSDVRNFLRKENLKFPITSERSKRTDDIFLNLYQEGEGTMTVPLNYIIDREGQIRAAWLGYQVENEKDIEILVRQLLNL